MTTGPPFDLILSKLDGVRGNGGKRTARCPAHDDTQASLSIGEGSDSRVLLKCFSGCTVENITSAMDLKMTDLFPPNQDRTYEPQTSQQIGDPWAWITQKTGLPRQAFESLGVVYSAEHKGFLYSFNGTAVKKVRPLQGSKGRWIKPNDAATPDLWPSPPETVPEHIILAAGESDCVTLRHAGYTAFTGTKGEGSPPSKAVFQALVKRGAKRLTTIYDRDNAGESGEQKTASVAASAGLDVHIATLPDDLVLGGGKDVNDLWRWHQRDFDAFRREMDKVIEQAVALDDAGVTGAQSDASPELDIVSLAAVEPQRVEWMWNKRIPVGKFTLIAGDPDLGKSTLTLDIASRVSRDGARWPDGELAPQGNVIVITAEDGIADTVRPRVDSLGGDVSNIFVMRVSVREGERDVALSLPDHMPLIEEAIVKYGIVLLIIDPVLAFTGGRRIDANKTNEVRPILMQLGGIAERTGCAILGVMHLNKNSAQGNSIYRISASLAFAAAARSVLGVGKHPDNPKLRVLVSIKHNLSAEPAPLAYYFDEDGKFTWDFNPVSVDANAVFAAAQADGGVVQEADDFLNQVLASGSVKWEELMAEAKTLEISAASLKRAKAKRVGTDNEIKSERVTMDNKGEGFWLWRYLTDDEMREKSHNA